MDEDQIIDPIDPMEAEGEEKKLPLPEEGDLEADVDLEGLEEETDDDDSA